MGEKRNALGLFKIGCGWMLNAKLLPGSTMRRRGEGGVEEWRIPLKGVGITDMQFGFHVVFSNEDDQAEVELLCQVLKDKFKAADLTVPSHGVELGRSDLLAYGGFLIDGGHRSLALERNTESAEEDKVDPLVYSLVPVHFYKRAALANVVIWSKVLNDTTSRCVPEDALERITFIQGLIDIYINEGHHEKFLASKKTAPKKKTKELRKPKTSELIAFVVAQSGKGVTDFTKDFTRHIINAAVNFTGIPTEHLTILVNTAESRHDEVGS
jgi:hypothetical protein